MSGGVILHIEAAIIEALRSAIPELSVEPFPEDPKAYNLLHPVGAVLIQYDGGNFGDSTTLGSTVQGRQLRFNIVSLTRNVRDSCGCYEILDRIRICLQGLKIPGCRLIRQTAERFASEGEGVWSYIQSFEIGTVQCQERPNYDAQNPTYESFI